MSKPRLVRSGIRFRKADGFTIVELIAVIVIIAILTVVITQEDPGPRIGMQASAEELIAAIRYTQMLSMSRGERFRINFFASSYTITDITGVTFVNHPATNATSTALPAGVTLTVNAAITSSFLAFDGKGIPYVTSSTPGTALSATGIVTLTSGSEAIAINIHPETGRVVI